MIRAVATIVERALRHQADAPVLEVRARLRLAQLDVRVVVDVVGRLQATHVVHLVARRFGVHLDAPEDMIARVLVGAERCRESRERAPRRVVAEVVGVGPLKEVRARPLHPRHRERVARDMAEACPPADRVTALLEPEAPVDAARVRLARQCGGQARATVHLPAHRRERAAERRGLPTDLLLQAHDRVLGLRFHCHAVGEVAVELERPSLRTPRGREQGTDRESRARAPSELRGTEDRAGARLVDEITRRREMRSPADAPRVEVVRSLDPQQLRPLGEERSPLLDDRLERREIHFGRIGLHLPEIGVDRRVHREVRPNAELGVDTNARLGRVAERIARVQLRGLLRVGGHVRQELRWPRRMHALDPGEHAETRDVPVLAARDHDPLEVLVLVGDPAVDLQPPLLRLHVGEADLRERDAHLGGPAERIDHRVGRPDGIVLALASAHLVVGRVVVVAPHARGRNGEPIARAEVVMRVERHLNALGVP